KFKDGEEIVYTVREENVPTGYEVTYDGTVQVGFTVTNTHTPEIIDIPVTKVWVDNNNQDGLRPDSITVILLANDEVVVGKEIVLNEGNGWSGVFEDLPKYENGEEINYTVKEKDEISGYITTITGNEEDGFTIKNTHETDETSIKVTKVWEDNDNQD